MPEAARVGDEIAHTQARSESLWGALKGALVGAVIGVALVALTVATAGTGTLAVIAVAGAYVAAGGMVIGGAGTGYFIGKQQGQQNMSPCGKIKTGSLNVFINGMAAAIACGSLADCSNHGNDKKVAQGSNCVTINSKYASRFGDHGECDFVIGNGSVNVLIGGGVAQCMAIQSEVPKEWDDYAKQAIIIGDTMQKVGMVMNIAGGLGNAFRSMFTAGLTRATAAGITMTATQRALLGTQVAARLVGSTVVGYGLSKGGGALGGAVARSVTNDPFIQQAFEGLGSVAAPGAASKVLTGLGAGRTPLPELQPGEQRAWGVKPDMYQKDVAEGIVDSNGNYIRNPRAQDMSTLSNTSQGDFRLNQQGRFQGKGNTNPMYAVDQNGNLIMGYRAKNIPGEPPPPRMPHPTLIGGEDPQVQAAGMVKIENGRITEVQYNNSGHYKPGSEAQEASQTAFDRLRAEHPGVFAPDVKYTGVDVPPPPPPPVFVPTFPQDNPRP